MGNEKVIVDVKLNGIEAKCNWHLASLASKKDNKTFDISFNHLVGHTEALMDNYGVARNESKILFTGCNHILEGAKGSITKQNAKIIVFDKDAQGVASPILRIDENDVKASHGASTGQLDESALFYMQQRCIDAKQARQLLIGAFMKEVLLTIEDEEQRNCLMDSVDSVLQ